MNKEQKIQELSRKIDELKQELEQLQKKSYEISYPEEDTTMYYIDDYTGKILHKVFDPDDHHKYLYDIGLLFDTKEEAEQFIRERALIKKIKCWAKEQQGDWQPDWSNENEGKHYMGYHYEDELIYVVTNKHCDSFLKLPYFKSKEITRACIDEFGDEIIEVFC
jgi:hypothetical protein